jgi:hypothetical protein
MSTLRFALFATFGVIPELLIVEEDLFTGGKNKIRPAVDTLHYSISEFHNHFPESGSRYWVRLQNACRFRTLSLYKNAQLGPGHPGMVFTENKSNHGK